MFALTAGWLPPGGNQSATEANGFLGWRNLRYPRSGRFYRASARSASLRGCRAISDGWLSAHGTCLGRAVRPRASIYRRAPVIKCAARPPTRVRGASTGVFSEPLATARHGFQALLNVPERSRTVGNFPQVDGPSEGLSAFGHGDAGRVRQVTD